MLVLSLKSHVCVRVSAEICINIQNIFWLCYEVFPSGLCAPLSSSRLCPLHQCSLGRAFPFLPCNVKAARLLSKSPPCCSSQTPHSLDPCVHKWNKNRPRWMFSHKPERKSTLWKLGRRREGISAWKVKNMTHPLQSHQHRLVPAIVFSFLRRVHRFIRHLGSCKCCWD